MSILQVKENILYCRDLNITLKFYTEILELPVITFVEGHHVFFGVGQNVLLCFNPESSKRKSSPPPHYASGPQHIAFEVEVEEYSNWKKKVSEHDIRIIDEVRWENNLESFYFLDPDEHVLEILPKGFWHPY